MTQLDGPPQLALFETAPQEAREPDNLTLAPGALVLRAFASEVAPVLLAAVEQVAQAASWRHMTTPSGPMSVAMTNCGDTGWVSDSRGYRYDGSDPQTNQPWPALPAVFADLAMRAAQAAGYAQCAPDACLINRYEPGARLALHQDRNERDFNAPIVSVSLGVPATFLWGGCSRADKPRKVLLAHGDVVVWGGPARLNFHGVAPLRADIHAQTGNIRFNLTFRRAR